MKIENLLKRLKEIYKKALKREDLYINMFEFIGLVFLLVFGISFLALNIALILTVFFFGPIVAFTLFFGLKKLISLSLITGGLLIGRDKEPIVIPPTTCGMLSVFGYRLDIFITEGTYPFIGRPIIDVLKVSETFGTKSGYIDLSNIQFKVWNSSSEPGIFDIMCHTADGVKITVKVTITAKVTHPRSLINASEPDVQIGDEARDAIRKIITIFIATDSYKADRIFGGMMERHTLVTVFLPDDCNEEKKGAIIKGIDGAMIYKMVKINPDDENYQEEVNKAKQELIAELEEKARPDLLEACQKDGKITVSTRHVNQSIKNTMENVGVSLIRAIVSDVQLPEGLTKALEKAAEEYPERMSAVKDAETSAEAAEIMDKHFKGKNRLAVAAAVGRGDDGIKPKVVVVEGSSEESLSKAAAIHGTLTAGGNDNVE